MFAIDPAFEATSLAVGELALSHVRLQDDARFVWLILIPRLEAAAELEDVEAAKRVLLMEEVVWAGRAVRQICTEAGRPIDKLNVASLGNVTRQLHIHIVGRWRDDPLWPAPVWGAPGASPLADPDGLLGRARAALGL